MTSRLLLALLLCLGTVLPAFALTPCDALKTEIAAKLKAKGVGVFHLESVPIGHVRDDEKIVGSCQGGAMKITYVRGVPRDLIANYGKGDSIRFGGMGDNFRCDDPAYAKIEKVETFSLGCCTPLFCRAVAPQPRKATKTRRSKEAKNTLGQSPQ
jgi:hypothetical protein